MVKIVGQLLLEHQMELEKHLFKNWENKMLMFV